MTRWRYGRTNGYREAEVNSQDLLTESEKKNDPKKDNPTTTTTTTTAKNTKEI